MALDITKQINGIWYSAYEEDNKLIVEADIGSDNHPGALQGKSKKALQLLDRLQKSIPGHDPAYAEANAEDRINYTAIIHDLSKEDPPTPYLRCEIASSPPNFYPAHAEKIIQDFFQVPTAAVSGIPVLNVENFYKAYIKDLDNFPVVGIYDIPHQAGVEPFQVEVVRLNNWPQNQTPGEHATLAAYIAPPLSLTTEYKHQNIADTAHYFNLLMPKLREKLGYNVLHLNSGHSMVKFENGFEDNMGVIFIKPDESLSQECVLAAIEQTAKEIGPSGKFSALINPRRSPHLGALQESKRQELNFKEELALRFMEKLKKAGVGEDQAEPLASQLADEAFSAMKVQGLNSIIPDSLPPTGRT